MDLKRGISYAVLLWLLIFVAISIIMFAAPITIQNALHFIVVPLLVLSCAGLYFKTEIASPSEGLKLGIIFLIVGTILDIAITIPLFIKSFAAFYTWDLFVGLAETIIFSVIAGKLYEKKPELILAKKPKAKAKKKKKK